MAYSFRGLDGRAKEELRAHILVHNHKTERERERESAVDIAEIF